MVEITTHVMISAHFGDTLGIKLFGCYVVTFIKLVAVKLNCLLVGNSSMAGMTIREDLFIVMAFRQFIHRNYSMF